MLGSGSGTISIRESDPPPLAFHNGRYNGFWLGHVIAERESPLTIANYGSQAVAKPPVGAPESPSAIGRYSQSLHLSDPQRFHRSHVRQLRREQHHGKRTGLAPCRRSCPGQLLLRPAPVDSIQQLLQFDCGHTIHCAITVQLCLAANVTIHRLWLRPCWHRQYRLPRRSTI